MLISVHSFIQDCSTHESKSQLLPHSWDVPNVYLCVLSAHTQQHLHSQLFKMHSELSLSFASKHYVPVQYTAECSSGHHWLLPGVWSCASKNGENLLHLQQSYCKQTSIFIHVWLIDLLHYSYYPCVYWMAYIMIVTGS